MGKKTKIIIGIVCALAVIIIWIFADIYHVARKQYDTGHEQSIALAEEKGYISSVDDIETFNSKIQYHVIAGENDKGQKVFVWVPQKKGHKILVKKRKAGITEKQAVTSVKNKYNPKDILHVQLGIDEGIPVWEVKYIDEYDRFTYDFVNFYDGKIQKHMAIRNDEKK